MKSSAFFGIDLRNTRNRASRTCLIALGSASRRLSILKWCRWIRAARSVVTRVTRSSRSVGIDPSDGRHSRLLFGSEFLDAFANRRGRRAWRRGRDFFTSVKSDMGTGKGVLRFRNCRGWLLLCGSPQPFCSTSRA